jgi:peptidoglycan/xylan/chitin deacetylase (PgdA/CDA1 family)
MVDFIYKTRNRFLISLVLFCFFIVGQVHYFPSIDSFLTGVLQKEIKWHGTLQQPLIALTFDDGPDPVYTTEIIAVLKKYHVPATFFVVGKNAAAHPELIRAELAAGCEIGNHTYSHPHLREMNLFHIKRQISHTDEIIQQITGQKPRLFRPPYEELNLLIFNASQNLQKTTIMSTVTLEHHIIKEPRRMAYRVVRMIRPGGIILAHDGRLDRSRTVSALPFLIRELKRKKYRFITVSELFELW